MALKPLVPAIALAACASDPSFPHARFANAPATWRVNDQLDVPKKPEAYPDDQFTEGYLACVERPLTRALELPRYRRALGTNALDEVPDSTWFTNRIGVRELSPDDVYRGPLTIESPELHKPWTVKSTKLGSGPQGGIIIVDNRGVKYMLKFDSPDEPETESGTHVAVNRLLWAAGYHVPEDLIVFLRPSDLVLAPDAVHKSRQGASKKKLGRAELDAGLAKVWHLPDGRIRALASRWLDGEPLGGPNPEGTRKGDRNDRIAHELRRDLRGRYPLFAWVDHNESTKSNALDMWQPDPRDGTRHYVVHYQIDFGRSFAVRGMELHDLREGHEYYWDYGRLGRAFVMFGFDDRSRGRHFAPKLRGVSPLFVAEDFEPSEWRPIEPYPPYDAADDSDMFWGAKIVARFTPEQIRAAVAAAQFSDPRATNYIVSTLVARQRATLAYWFGRVNPVDHFVMADGGVGVPGLCFDDLAITSGVAGSASTRYMLASFDARGKAIAPAMVVAAARGGQTCTPVVRLAERDRDAYTIVRVTTTRAGTANGRATYVHVAREPRTGAPRVVGIWRE